jgi:hypothetical protein
VLLVSVMRLVTLSTLLVVLEPVGDWTELCELESELGRGVSS